MPEDARKILDEIKATAATERTVDARIAEATARQVTFAPRNRAARAAKRRTA